MTTIRQRWKIWTSKSTNYRIFGAASIVGSATGVVYIVKAAKELTVGAHFGTTDAMDAYLLAYLLPSFCINVVAGPVSSALIPVFIHLREKEGFRTSLSLLAGSNLWGGVLLLCVTIVLIGCGSSVLPLLASDFAPDKLALTQSMFYCLLPLIVLQGMANIWASILNALERFALAAAAPCMPSLVTLAFLFFGPGSWAIYNLVWGALVGTLLQLVLLFGNAVRLKIVVRPSNHPALVEVARQYWPVIAGAALMAGTTVIDQAMAATLSPGSLASLAYGDRVVAAILGLGSTALGTAMLPNFSRLAAAEKWADLAHTLKVYKRLIWLFSLLLTLVFLVFSEPVVRLLWERGAFTSADTQLVSQIQVCYVFRMPFYMVGIIVVRLLSSLRANRFLFFISGINLILNVIFNIIFMKWWGVTGLALSTSAVYVISYFMLSYTLKACWPGHDRASMN
jgi:putative peptidoglycan lipid II flippase